MQILNLFILLPQLMAMICLAEPPRLLSLLAVNAVIEDITAKMTQ
jgi:hypothetical protein